MKSKTDFSFYGWLWLKLLFGSSAMINPNKISSIFVERKKKNIYGKYSMHLCDIKRLYCIRINSITLTISILCWAIKMIFVATLTKDRDEYFGYLISHFIAHFAFERKNEINKVLSCRDEFHILPSKQSWKIVMSSKEIIAACGSGDETRIETEAREREKNETITIFLRHNKL